MHADVYPSPSSKPSKYLKMPSILAGEHVKMEQMPISCSLKDESSDMKRKARQRGQDSIGSMFHAKSFREKKETGIEIGCIAYALPRHKTC